MKYDFADRVAFVTGAGSGIGRASARAFAGGDALVCVADIDFEAAKATIELIEAAGGSAVAYELDISNHQAVRSTLTDVVKRYGRLDFAHNNVGVGRVGPTAEIAPEDWDLVIGVNLSGTFYCMRCELEIMLEQGHGAIVNTSAGIGLVNMPLFAAYAASKAGINALTQVAALDHSAEGVRVNAVCPGQVDTPALAGLPPEAKDYLLSLHAVGRLAQADEIANAVAWLCSDDASYITGALLAVDGGFTAGTGQRTAFAATFGGS